MTRLLDRTLRSFVALLVVMAVFTPVTAQAACVTSCGGCSMSGAMGAAMPVSSMPMQGGSTCLCCSNPDAARMSSCDHGNDSSRSLVSVQPAETMPFTVAVSTAPAPPLATSVVASVAGAHRRPPTGRPRRHSIAHLTSAARPR